MGEVYRARDTRLDRTVAIKVLPAALAADPAFRERFEREARSISALNHPHICTLHDVGSHDGVEFLVMEYLEGQTLADRLARGPMKADEALRLATQIADALDRAHRHGIIHRDLKPANVMLVRGASGAVAAKLLDFGIAKQAGSVVATSGVLSTPGDATRTSPLTDRGAIVGTFQYLAPEQIQGAPADARSDIWAFGCVLYEMLSSTRPFEAPTQAGVMAAILEREPPPLQLSGDLAPGLRRLIGACLEKNPDDRFQSLRDVRREIEWLSTPTGATPPERRGWRSPVLAWTVAAIAIAAALGTAAVLRRRPAQTTTAAAPLMFNLTVGSLDAQISEPAVSPDGRRIAFVALREGARSIWLRTLDTLEPQPVKGTDDGRFAFWSPDGTSLGFFAAGKLKTVELASGKIDVVCDAPLGFGGTWGPDGTILFSPDEHAPIFRVNAQGGTPAQVTTLDTSRNDQAHRWPDFLPDGRHFLFMPWTDGSTTRAIQVASVDGSTPPRTVLEAQSAARVAGKHLLFALDRPSRVMAVPFDLTTLQVRGRAFQAVPDENFNYLWMSGYPAVSISRTSTLAYSSGKFSQMQLTWVDRTGRPVGTVGEAAPYFDPALSADGEHLAIEKHDWARGSGDVWTVDLARGAFSRLSSAPGFESAAVWSPDGRRVAYASDQGERPMIYVKNASGAGSEEMLNSGGTRAFPTDWSRDGRYILFTTRGGNTRTDVWAYDFERRTAAPVIASPFNESAATFSPDGKWVAFASDASQDSQIYIRSVADAAMQVQISTHGGAQPRWRRDGKELYYVAPDNTIMAVAIDTRSGTVRAGTPQPLFTANINQAATLRNQYAPSADGQRFLVLALVNRNLLPIVVVSNWAPGSR
jgi:serine/threonine protein kinase/Tol biopolymer transport system component